jgi:hypothetical protein
MEATTPQRPDPLEFAPPTASITAVYVPCWISLMFILAQKALATLTRALMALLPWKKVSIDASLILRLKWRCDAPE